MSLEESDAWRLGFFAAEDERKMIDEHAWRKNEDGTNK